MNCYPLCINYCTTYSAPFRSFKSIIPSVRLLISESPLWINKHYLIPGGYELLCGYGKEVENKSESNEAKVCWLLLHIWKKKNAFVTLHSGNPYETVSSRDQLCAGCGDNQKAAFTHLTVHPKINKSKCLLAGHGTLKKTESRRKLQQMNVYSMTSPSLLIMLQIIQTRQTS